MAWVTGWGECVIAMTESLRVLIKCVELLVYTLYSMKRPVHMKCLKGTLHEGRPNIPRKLHQVHLPFLDQSVCDKEYGREIDNQVMFCAGAVGLDSCQVL